MPISTGIITGYEVKQVDGKIIVERTDGLIQIKPNAEVR